MSVFTAPEQMCQPKSMNFVRKMYVGTRIPSVEPHGLARGFSQGRAFSERGFKMRDNKFLKKEDITINDLIKKYGIVAVLWASTIVIISEFLDDYGRCIFYIFFGLFIMWAYVSF